MQASIINPKDQMGGPSQRRTKGDQKGDQRDAEGRTKGDERRRVETRKDERKRKEARESEMI